MSSEEYEGNGDSLMMDLDYAGKKSAQDLGRTVVTPGRYHVLIQRIERVTMKDKLALRFRFRILAGTSPDMIGKLHTENVFLSEGSKERFELLAYRAGLTSAADFGKQVRIDWTAAIGRQVVIKLDTNKFIGGDGKEQVRSQMTFDGLWSVTDPDVADVPKDPEELAEAGLVVPQSPPRNWHDNV